MRGRDIDDIREEYNERIAICLEAGVSPKIAKEIALKESRIKWKNLKAKESVS